MSGGYDGSIKFDTSIDSKGFNTGIKRISGSLKGVMGALSKGVLAIGGIVAGVVAAIVTIAATLVGAGISIFAWAQKFTNTLFRALAVTSAYRDKVIELKGAFDTLKGAVMGLGMTLLSAIAPAIMTVINWLVKAINYVSMFIAAITGQKQVMQYVSGSTEGAANSAGKLAKNTKDAGKAAKGALAAFDQLNVLQMQDPQEEGSGGGGNGGNVVMQPVPIPSNILETAEKIRQWFKGVCSDISDYFTGLWSDIQNAWQRVSIWFEYNVILPLSAFFSNLWYDIKRIFWEVIDWIVQAWNNAGGWIKQAWADVGQFFYDLWEKIKAFAAGAWQKIVEIWGKVKEWFLASVINPIKNFFTDVWEVVKNRAEVAWNRIAGIWMIVKAWFTEHVTEPLKAAFATALDWVKTKFETIFTGVKDFVKGIINGLIDLLNGMLKGAVSGLNLLVDAANKAGGSLPGWKTIPSVTAPQIPRLATGAVIPPNNRFLAVLGDQRAGRNIEAPEGLLRQIADEAYQKNQGSQNITINFTGSMSELIRVLKPEVERENRRLGSSLI